MITTISNFFQENKHKIALLSFVCFCCIFAFVVLVSNLKGQILIPDVISKNVRKAFPQGWSFFTKDPREEYLTVYRINDQNEKVLFTFNNRSSENNYGLSREARYRLYHAAQTMYRIQDDSWTESKKSKISSANPKTEVLEFDERFYKMTEGEYLFILERPTPVYWGKSQDMNKQVKILNVNIIAGE